MLKREKALDNNKRRLRMPAGRSGSFPTSFEKIPRFQLRTPLPVFVHSAGHWRAGNVHNLSERGAFISLDAEVWVGEEVELILGLPESAGGRLQLRAVTVWRTIFEEPGRPSVKAGYGLLFTAESSADSSLPRAIHALAASGFLNLLPGRE